MLSRRPRWRCSDQPGGQQRPYDRGMALGSRPMQRRMAAVADDIDIRPSGRQPPGNLGVAVEGSPEQGHPAAIVGGIDIRSGGEHRSDDLGLAVSSCKWTDSKPTPQTSAAKQRPRSTPKRNAPYLGVQVGFRDT